MKREAKDASVQELSEALEHVRAQHGEALSSMASVLQQVQVDQISAFARNIQPMLADLRLHESLTAQWAPIIDQFKTTALLPDMVSGLAAYRSVVLPHLEAHQAFGRSIQSALASVDLGIFKTNLLAHIESAQLAASTAAWGALVSRDLALFKSLDFSVLQQAVVGVSEAVAAQLDMAAQFRPALRLRVTSAMETAVLGIRPRGTAGVLRGVSTGLRAFTATALQRGEVAPASFAAMAGTGVAGLAASSSPRTTSSEVSALDGEVREAGMELIRRERPELVHKMEGALFAIRSGSPDAASQAAHSLQELIDRLLRAIADDTQALEWCEQHYKREGIYPKPDGSLGVTRAGKIRFVANQNGIPDDIADALARIVICSTQILQRGKHDEAPVGLIANLSLVVEGSAGALIAMTLRRIG